MCIATALAYAFVSTIFLEEAMSLDPAHYEWPSDGIPKVLRAESLTIVYAVLAWTAEFAVKISLLLFFKVLVKRVQRLTFYVNCVIGIVTVVWAVLVCEPFMFCPYFGLAALSKSSDTLVQFTCFADRACCKAKCGVPNVPLILGLSILIAILDIATDLMSIISPTLVM